MREGLWTFYYDNGNIESSGAYSNDTQTGEWRFYNKKGKLARTIITLINSLLNEH